MMMEIKLKHTEIFEVGRDQTKTFVSQSGQNEFLRAIN